VIDASRAGRCSASESASHPPVRGAYQVHAVQVERGERFAEPGGVAGLTGEPAALHTAAEVVEGVDRVHRAVLAERGDLRVPVRRVAGAAVQQNDRRALGRTVAERVPFG
jgi:hypothetical protein